MTAPRPPPVWCAPSNVLDPRPQRVAANMEARSRHGQPAAPYGPGWCRGKRYRNVHFAMLDAETNRWARAVEEPVNAANQSEFVTPQPAGPTPIDLVQIGAIYDKQAKTIQPHPRAGHRRTVQSSDRSAFVFQDPDNARDGSHIGDYVPEQRHGNFVNFAGDWNVGDGIDFDDPQSTLFFQQLHPNPNDRGLSPANHNLNAEDLPPSNKLRTHPNQLSIPKGRDVFPDLFYTYNPSVYAKYKDDCSGGYASFSTFIRHSLEKHNRHGNVAKEGISPETLERARTVAPRSSVPRKDKTLTRYLLVRQTLFGTDLDVPIPACEHGETHPVRKARSTKRKRSTSFGNSSIAEASGSNEIPSENNNITPNNPRSIPAVRICAPSQTPERLAHDEDLDESRLRMLARLESDFVLRHKELKGIMVQTSNVLNIVAQNLPSGLKATEDVDRCTRLRNILQKYIGWANESCSKLSDFRYSEEFPKIVESDAMPFTASFASTQSTSSGPPMTPSVYTPEDAISQEAQGQ